MRFLPTIGAVLILSAGVSLAHAAEAEVGSTAGAADFTAELPTGRSAFNPSSATVPADKPVAAAVAPGSVGGCSPVPARDGFGDTYRLCAARTINPTEEDELMLSVELSPVGGRVKTADVFASPSVLASYGFSGEVLPAGRFTVPAATAAR